MFGYEMALTRIAGMAQARGLEVLDRGWRADGLDGICGLVTLDPEDGTVVFVDVAFEVAEPGAKAYVMPRPGTRLAQMRRIAERWFAAHGDGLDPEKARFDSASVLETGTGKVFSRWARNALV